MEKTRYLRLEAGAGAIERVGLAKKPKVSVFRRWFMRLTMLFLIPIVLLLSPIRDVLLKEIIIQQLSSQLGEEVWISQVKSGIIPLTLKAKGVRIGNYDENYIHITQVDIQIELEEEKPLFSSIIVQSPIVSLPFDNDGLIPFRNRIKGGRPIQEFPFSTLEIYDGVFVAELGGNRYRTYNLSFLYHSGEATLAFETDPLPFREKHLQLSPIKTPLLLTPNTLFIPEMNLEFEGLTIDGSLEIRDGIEGSFHVQGEMPSFIRGRKIHMEGELDTEILLHKKSAELEISMEGQIENARLHRLLRNGKRDFIPFQELEHHFVYRDEVVQIERLYSPFAGGRALATGSYDPIEDLLAIGIDLEDIPMWKLGSDLRFSSSPWVDGIVNGSLILEGSLRDFNLEGPIELRSESVDIALGPIRKRDPFIEAIPLHIQGMGAFTRTNFSLKKASLDSRDSRGVLSYFVQWGEEPFTDIKFDFSHIVLDVIRPLSNMSLLGNGSMKGRIWGKPKQLQFFLNPDLQNFGLFGFGPIDNFSSKIKGETLREWKFHDMVLQHGETSFTGPMQIDFSKKMMKCSLETIEGQIQDIIPIFFSFSSFLGDAQGMVNIEGPFQDLDIHSQFTLSDTTLWGEPFSEGIFSLHMRKKFLTIEELILRNGSHELLMRGSMNEDKEMNFEIHSNEWDVKNIDSISRYNLPLDGKIQINTFLQGKGIQPRGLIQLFDVRYNQIPLKDGDIHFDMEGAGLAIHGGLPEVGVSLTGNTQSLYISDDYSMNMQLNNFPAHIFYPESRTGEKIRMKSSGEVHFESYNHEFFMELQLNKLDFTIRDLVLSLRKPTAISIQPEEISLSGVEIGDGKKSNFQISGGKTFEGELDYQLWGTLDLAYLTPLIGLADRSAGLADIKGTLQGLPSNPLPQFTVTIQDGDFSADWWDHPYQQVQGKVFISPYRYELLDWKGRMGGGDLNVAGVITADFFSVKQLDIKLDMIEGQVQPISWLPPMQGNANLRLIGSLEEMLLKGDVDISNMLFSKRIDWEDAMISIDSTLLEESTKRELDTSWLAFHVDISADDTVRIRNNLADLTASAQFQMIGDLNRIGMIGNLKAKPGGRILLKERDFDVQRAEIRFLEPYSYDPELDIALFTRVRSIDEEYDINYYVEGLYSRWRFRSHSNPPLQQADINALLFFGMTRAELERMGGLSNTLAIEGTDLLASKVGSSLDIVSRFNEVRDGVFQFDRFDLISGTSTSGAFSSSLRILAEKDLTTGSRLRFEKDLTQTEDFYLSFEQKLANTFYLRSFWTSEQRGRYLDIGGAYGVEFQLRLEAD